MISVYDDYIALLHILVKYSKIRNVPTWVQTTMDNRLRNKILWDVLNSMGFSSPTVTLSSPSTELQVVTTLNIVSSEDDVGSGLTVPLNKEQVQLTRVLRGQSDESGDVEITRPKMSSQVINASKLNFETFTPMLGSLFVPPEKNYKKILLELVS